MLALGGLAFLMMLATWRRILSELTEGNLKRAGSILLIMGCIGMTLGAMAKLKPLDRTEFSNQCRWFRVHPEKQRPSPCWPISLYLPFLELICLQPTGLTMPLSLECSGVSTFHLQLCVDAQIHQGCDEKVLKQLQRWPHDCICSPLIANEKAPTLPRFFRSQWFTQNRKFCTLRCLACHRNYFVHLSISSGVVTYTGRPERLPSFIDVRPRLIHLLIYKQLDIQEQECPEPHPTQPWSLSVLGF